MNYMIQAQHIFFLFDMMISWEIWIFIITYMWSLTIFFFNI